MSSSGKFPDSHPSTAPRGDIIDEILHILFTPEEASIAVKLNFKPEMPAGPAEARGISESEAEKCIESMANRSNPSL
jgi:hypothetical protein